MLARRVQSAREGPGDDGAAGAADRLFGFGGEGGFERVGVEVDFAGGDFFGCRSVETELADSETVFCLQRRAEDAAGDGAGRVEVAESGSGIEDGAGFVVGEVLEVGGARVIEKAGSRVAGKIRSEASDGLPGALADGGGAFGIGRIESGESVAQAGGVKLGDGEDADAALGAPGSAFEPGTGAMCGVGDGGIDDLNEQRVAGGERHGVRIEQRGDEKFVIWERYAAGSGDRAKREPNASKKRARDECKTREKRAKNV